MEIEGKNICIFCGSSPSTKEEYINAAYRLGELMGQKGIGCVSGAGRSGMMAAARDGTLDQGGTDLGVIPIFMVERRWNSQGLTTT